MLSSPKTVGKCKRGVRHSERLPRMCEKYVLPRRSREYKRGEAPVTVRPPFFLYIHLARRARRASFKDAPPCKKARIASFKDAPLVSARVASFMTPRKARRGTRPS